MVRVGNAWRRFIARIRCRFVEDGNCQEFFELTGAPFSSVRQLLKELGMTADQHRELAADRRQRNLHERAGHHEDVGNGSRHSRGTVWSQPLRHPRLIPHARSLQRGSSPTRQLPSFADVAAVGPIDNMHAGRSSTIYLKAHTTSLDR
jgi:hypothetical protein